MKKTLIVLFVLILAFTLTADEGAKAFKKGDKLLDLSFGFSSLSTPFAAGYEVGITENLGVNVSALFISWGYDLGWLGDLNQTLIMPQANVVYHFTKIKSPKFDLYTGAGAGFSIYSSDWDDETGTGGIFLTGILGVRYYVSKKISISLRETLVFVGDWGGSYTLLGVSFKF